MKLDDFLKCKKVRCVKERGEFLTIGKEYDVLDRRVEIKIIYDEGYSFWFDSDQFEPVLDTAENPLQDVELTPEFETEASEPKFKVGDKVYYGSEYRILTIAEFDDDGWIRPDRWVGFINDKQCCHATHENYEMLCKLYPHIEFEAPPKPLTGIELAKKLIAKGHNYLVVDTVIGIRVLTRLEGNTLIDSNNVRLDELDDITPLNDETGKPLTESILND